MRDSLLTGMNLGAVAAALQADPGGAGKAGLVALYLKLDDIAPDPDQPRRVDTTDEEEVQALQDLASSILQHGVIQPITVEEVDRGSHSADGPLPAKGKYRIITGERRWRAAVIALESGQPCARKGYDLTRIPAIITKSEDPADRLEIQLVENLARADMKAEDVAAALQNLLDTLGVSRQNLAQRIGRSEAWLRRMLQTGSVEARQIADRLGLPVGDIGTTEMQRLLAWQKDPERSGLIDAVMDAVQGGQACTRSLLDRLEKGRTGPLPEPEEPVPALQDEAAADDAGEGMDLAGSAPAPAETIPVHAETAPVESLPQADTEDEDTEGHAIPNDAIPLAGCEPPAGWEPSASITVSLPMEVVQRLFKQVGEPFDDPSPERVLNVLLEVLSDG